MLFAFLRMRGKDQFHCHACAVGRMTFQLPEREERKNVKPKHIAPWWLAAV